jgi:TolB protein
MHCRKQQRDDLRGMGRRAFLAAASVLPELAVSLSAWAMAGASDATRHDRLFFTSRGKTALVNADGSGLRYLHFDKPGQATWQPAAVFPDGRRVLLLSMEPRRDGPGRPFSEYYTQTPTHLWIYDLETGSLEEICTMDRLAPFETPALLLSHADRLLVQVVRRNVGQIYSVRLGGSAPRERIIGWQVRCVLSREDRRGARDLGHERRRQGSPARHPRDQRSGCGPPALALTTDCDFV